MLNRKVYCDFDGVIYDYDPAMAWAIKEIYDLDVDLSKVNDKNLENHFENYNFDDYLKNKFYFTAKMIMKAVELANTYSETNLTPFCRGKSKFLKFLKKEASDNNLIIISARQNYHTLEKHLENINISAPVITCHSYSKPAIIGENAIFFEDRADTAISCAKTNLSTIVIVPSWAWNRKKIVNGDNIEIVGHEELYNGHFLNIVENMSNRIIGEPMYE